MSEDLLLARLARRPGLIDSPLGAIVAPYVNALCSPPHYPQLPERRSPLRVLDQCSWT